MKLQITFLSLLLLTLFSSVSSATTIHLIFESGFTDEFDSGGEWEALYDDIDEIKDEIEDIVDADYLAYGIGASLTSGDIPVCIGRTLTSYGGSSGIGAFYSSSVPDTAYINVEKFADQSALQGVLATIERIGRALGGTASHEVGHLLNLRHVYSYDSYDPYYDYQVIEGGVPTEQTELSDDNKNHFAIDSKTLKYNLMTSGGIIDTTERAETDRDFSKYSDAVLVFGLNGGGSISGHVGLSDTVDLNLVWGGELTVSSNITVDSDNKLYLSPNTTLKMNSGKTITINGEITVCSGVLFTKSSTNWDGIIINNGGTMTLNSLGGTIAKKIEYATTGVTINANSSTPIDNGVYTLTIDNCTTGMTIYNSTATIQNISFDNITDDAIEIDYSSSDPTIDAVSIYDGEYGIDIHSSADATLTDSELEGMDEDNIYFENSAGIDMNGGHNDVTRTSGKHAINNARPSTVFINVNYNYWNGETTLSD